jgi:hypothetical protein
LLDFFEQIIQRRATTRNQYGDSKFRFGWHRVFQIQAF